MQAEEAALQTGQQEGQTRHPPESLRSEPASYLPTSSAAAACVEMETKVTDFSGKWKMKSSENFEELLKALGKLWIIAQPSIDHRKESGHYVL